MQVGDITLTDEAVNLPRAVVANITRDMSLAAGSSSYTGLGFRPSAIITASAELNINAFSSVGLCGHDTDQTTEKSINISRIYNDTYDASGSFAFHYESAGPLTRFFGAISSYDADGFTVAWTKNGSPTGTLYVAFLVFK